MKPYWLRILLAIDQFFAVLILNSHEDVTISGHVGRYHPGSWMERAINFLFWDKEHCKKSVEWDEQ